MGKKRALSTYFRNGCFGLIAVIMPLLFNENSPLYRYNHWTDANYYFTVGRGVAHGEVMYQQLFDQKGPLLYFLHAFAAWLTPGHYWGMLPFTMVSLWLSLILAYRLASQYLPPLAATIVTCIFGLCIFTPALYRRGDSAEELCLPAILLVFVLLHRYLQTHALPQRWETMLAGFGLGWIVLIKFSLMLGPVAFFFVLWTSLLRHRSMKVVLSQIGFAFAGFAIAWLIPLIYFIGHHALGTFGFDYFYVNLILYRPLPGASVLQRLLTTLAAHGPVVIAVVALLAVILLFALLYLWRWVSRTVPLRAWAMLVGIGVIGIVGLAVLKPTLGAMLMLVFITRPLKMFLSFPLVALLWACGLIGLIGGSQLARGWSQKCMLLIVALATLVGALIPALSSYYYLGAVALALPGLIVLANWVRLARWHLWPRLAVLSLCVLVPVVTAIGHPYLWTESRLTDNKLANAVPHFVKTVSANDQLLVYRAYDAGFYNVTNTLPSVRYFAKYNITSKALPGTETAPAAKIRAGKVTVVITTTANVSHVQALNPHYRVITTARLGDAGWGRYALMKMTN